MKSPLTKSLLQTNTNEPACRQTGIAIHLPDGSQVCTKKQIIFTYENKNHNYLNVIRNSDELCSKWEPYHQFSSDAGYTFSSLKENQNPSRLLFVGNGVNFGVGHRWGDTWGIASRIGFAIGS